MSRSDSSSRNGRMLGSWKTRWRKSGRYQEIGQRIVAAVTAAHPELDFPVVFLKQYWETGYIGFGKRSWPDGGGNAPSGLYVHNLRLELLTSDEEEPPIAYIWMPKSAKVDPALARTILQGIAETELAPDEYRALDFDDIDDRGETCIYFPAPSREELLSALLEGDGQRFVDLIVNRFEGMARFIPALDKLLLKAI